MPFTPFHLGPAILFGLLMRKYIDFSTFVIANLIVDTRAVMVFFGFLDGPLHGFLHTFVFASHLGILLAGITYYLQPYTAKLMNLSGLEQLTGWKNFIGAGLLGAWFHVFLDSILYSDMAPFMPSDANPLLGIVSPGVVYGFCLTSLVLGVVYHLKIYSRQAVKPQ